MRIKATISHVGEPQTGTRHDGTQWTKRTIVLTHTVTLDNGRQVTDQFLTEYFGDTPNDELLLLAADAVPVECTVWCGINEYTTASGQRRRHQTLTLQSLARLM